MMGRIVDTRGEYKKAYDWYITAQGECPHWDYETPDGVGAQCCQDMVTAHNSLKRIKRQLQNA